MPTLVNCPRCAKPYRLGAEVPLTFSCRACGEEMDLWKYTAAARPRGAGAAAGGGTPRKPMSPIGLAVSVLLMTGAIVLGFVASRDEHSAEDGPSLSAAEVDALLHAHESPEARQRRLEMDAAVARLKRQAARLSITSPKSNEVVGATVHVVGALTSGSADERVLVDRVEVRRGPGPFETTVTLKQDQTYIDLTIEGPSSVLSTGISVKRAP